MINEQRFGQIRYTEIDYFHWYQAKYSRKAGVWRHSYPCLLLYMLSAASPTPHYSFTVYVNFDRDPFWVMKGY